MTLKNISHGFQFVEKKNTVNPSSCCLVLMTEGRDAGWWWGVSGRVSPWRNFLISYQGSTWGGLSGAFKMEEISIVCTIKCCLSTFPQVQLLFAHFILVQQEAIYYHQSVWTHCENKISNQMSRLKIDLTYQIIIWCQTWVINYVLFASLFFLLLDDRCCDRGPTPAFSHSLTTRFGEQTCQLNISFDESSFICRLTSCNQSNCGWSLELEGVPDQIKMSGACEFISRCKIQ